MKVLLHCFLSSDTRWRWLVSRMPRLLSTCVKCPPVSIGQEIEWDRNPIWALRRRGNPSLALKSNLCSEIFQLVGQELHQKQESGKGIENFCLTRFCSVAKKKKWRKFVFWYVTPFRLVNSYWRSKGHIAFIYKRVSNLFCAMNFFKILVKLTDSFSEKWKWTHKI